MNTEQQQGSLGSIGPLTQSVKTVILESNGSLTLRGSFNPFELGEKEAKLLNDIGNLINQYEEQKKKKEMATSELMYSGVIEKAGVSSDAMAAGNYCRENRILISCEHDRLNDEGYCRKCGADRRGI